MNILPKKIPATFFSCRPTKKWHFVKVSIVDSGLGGLSVCAFLERSLHQGNLDSVAIQYINAVPQENLGYNQMSSRAQKIETFQRVLEAIQNRHQPDFIFIACHTLSAFLAEIPFCKNPAHPPVEGMIQLGVSLLFSHLSKEENAGVLILATETTIGEGIYLKHLEHLGIAPDRIISQDFPGVATLISNDREGKRVYSAIEKPLQQALSQAPPSLESWYAYLGCTHYGYGQKLFQKAFEAAKRPQVSILNPNQAAAQKIFSHIKNHGQPSPPFPTSMEFLTRYPLPQTEIQTVAHFLAETSLPTAHALQNHTPIPHLF